MAANRPATAPQPPDDPPRGGIGLPAGLGPYSRSIDGTSAGSRTISRGAVGGLNGNSAEARFIKTYEAMLTEHCGSPTAVQRQLIIRASRLALHLELWDQRTIPNGGAVTATGHNHYIAWNNALARTLARLGAAAAERPGAALERHLAALEAHQAAGGSEAA